MKITYRIPTQDPYAYVEIEQELIEVTDKEIREKYEHLTNEFKPKSGLSEKEFNAIIDEYLLTKKITNGQESYEKMSPDQQAFIQLIKRSFNRIKNK